MASSSGDGLVFVIPEGVKFAGIRTPQEQRDFLQETLSIFEGTGVRWEQMSPQECEKLGFTLDQFARKIRNINQFKDVESLEKAWFAAMKGGGVAMMHMAKLIDVRRFSDWLKSAEGLKAIKAIAVEARFQRRATMVAKCGMLDQMYGAYSTKMKATIIEYDEEIQQHMREIARLKKLTEENLAAVTAEYYPASAYVELPLSMLQERAYEIYLEQSRIHGARYFPRMLGGFESAVSQYGNRVRQEHKVEFVQRPEVFEELKKWMETSILRLTAEGQTRAAQTFRDTVAAATGKRPVAATPPTEERRDDQDERGSPEPTREQQQPPPAEIVAQRGTVEEQETTRSQTIPIISVRETRRSVSQRNIQTRSQTIPIISVRETRRSVSQRNIQTRSQTIPIISVRETRRSVSQRNIQTRFKNKRAAGMERGAQPGHSRNQE